MVLINGVKYACERCIRGHRVTTCSHTDQPLTMIKPKGRPTTQCQHCRDQRKNKNLHIQCTCGKKGKSPGMHLGSCLCHKNSHCTCSANANKKIDYKKKLQKSGSELSVGGCGQTTKIESPVSGGSPRTASTPRELAMETMMAPFNMGSGLFDLFSPSSENFSSNSTANRGGNAGNAEGANSGSNSGSVNSRSPTGVNNNGADADPDSLKEDDMNMPGNMFPLFPLVGNCSFSDSKNQPLTGVRDGAAGTRETTNYSTAQYQPIRPKRPESSLSMASNSSSVSRTNLDNANYQNASVGSSAYPPNPFTLGDRDLSGNEQFTAKDFYNDENDLRFNEYEQLFNPSNQQNEVDKPQDTAQGKPDSGDILNQNAPNFDIENYPMFTDLILPMGQEQKNDTKNE